MQKMPFIRGIEIHKEIDGYSKERTKIMVYINVRNELIYEFYGELALLYLKR
jgi:hypothetical protein